MRIWHRLKTISPLLLTILLSASAQAQGIFGAPGGGNPAMNAGPPGQSAIGYQGMPGSFQPYPHLSPYEHASQQHVNDGGLWYSDTVNHFEDRAQPFTYNVQLEWLRSEVRDFDEEVGDPNGVTTATESLNLLLSPDIQTYRLFLPPLMGQIPDARPEGFRLTTTIESREGWSVGLHGTWSDETVEEFSARKARDRFRGDEVDSLVFGLTGGIGNPGPIIQGARDTTDLDIALSFLLLDGPTFDAIDLDAVDLALRGNLTDVFNRTLISEVSLPLFDPTLIGRGTYQRFDIDFSIQHSIESFGAGGFFETAPIFERGGIQFRGVAGGRYMRINEGFHFRGVDSGLFYTITNDPTQVDRIDNDGDFFVDDIDEAGSGGDFAAFNLSNELLIRAFADSVVETSLAGPEVGLSYNLGRKVGIDLTGSTRVGALFNDERVRLTGDNIGGFRARPSNFADGDDFAIDPVTNQLALLSLFDTSTSNGQPTQNAFSDSVEKQHLSPMFEQNLTATLPLFSRIPILRDMAVLENATFQAGYTFLWIGEVAEPHNSIVWTSNPRAGVFPTLNVQRKDFYQHSFRLGINCEY